MSPSIVTTFSIFMLSSMSTNFGTNARTISSSSNSLIPHVCSNTGQNFDPKLCHQILQSDPTIASSANLLDLSINIIELGISNATTTLAHLDKMTKKVFKESNMSAALFQCKSSYDSALVSLKSALSEIKYYKQYDTATYDLLIASTDNISPCQSATIVHNINDVIILTSNKVVPIFGLSAYKAVDSLVAGSASGPAPQLQPSLDLV